MHLLFFTWLTEQADGLIRRFYIFGIAAAPAAAISLVLPLLPEQGWTGVSAAEPFVCGQSVNKIRCRVSLQTLGLVQWFSSLQPPVKAECGLGSCPGCLGAPVRNCWAVRLLSLPFPGPLPHPTPDAPRPSQALGEASQLPIVGLAAISRTGLSQLRIRWPCCSPRCEPLTLQPQASVLGLGFYWGPRVALWPSASQWAGP